MKPLSVARVETEVLSAARRDALRELLDDTSPAVRRALLLQFAQLGAPAAAFLHSVAGGSNRVLARHAV